MVTKLNAENTFVKIAVINGQLNRRKAIEIKQFNKRYLNHFQYSFFS